MPFGKFGPKQGDHRQLKDLPEGYLRWLAQQEVLYHHRELGEWIEQRLFDEGKNVLKVRKSDSQPAAPITLNNPSATEKARADLKEFLKTL